MSAARKQRSVRGFSFIGLVLLALLISPNLWGQMTETWVRRYNHPTEAGAFATKIVTDNSGNVVVIGDTAKHWIVLKLSPQGVPLYSTAGAPLWTNHYLLPSGGDILAVAEKGKVIVAGNYGATIAYSNEGSLLWTNRYPGAPAAIAINTNGQVYITGSSSGDYVTVAYASSGAPLWTNRCRGSGLKGSITLNPDASVLVTGSSWSGRSVDLATLAYSNQGIPLWTNRYNNYEGNREDQAKALTVSASGAVFVTGSSLDEVSQNDYATVAYSSTGEALWTNRYNGQDNLGDFPTAMTRASNGNIFVTGYSENETKYVTVAYSGAGQPLWTNLFAIITNGFTRAAAIGVDSVGNCFVTGTAGDEVSLDFATVGYSPSGEALWTNRYGPGGYYDANAIAVDSSDRIFVAGPSAGTTFDYATIAYSNAGQPLWTNRYGMSSDHNDIVKAIAVDPNGNVIVTGDSGGHLGATVAYSSAGTALWTNQCELSPKAIATDVSGRVFLAGTLVSTNNLDRDYGTVAYSSNGTALWTNRFSRAEGFELTVAIAVNQRGQVVVAAPSREDSTWGITTVTYSINGQGLWTNRYTGHIYDEFLVAGLATDAFGNVILAGTVSRRDPFQSDFIAIKYALETPTLGYQVLNSQLVLSWSDAGFELQAAPLVSGTFDNVPDATSPYTNSFVGSQKFFRLKSR